MTDSERVKILCQWLISNNFAENKGDLAKKMGYHRGYFSTILSGEQKMSYAIALKFTKVCDKINIMWLLNGEGDMVIGSNVFVNNGSVGDSNNIQTDISPEYVRMLIKQIEHKDEQLRQKDEQIEKLLNLIASGKR